MWKGFVTHDDATNANGQWALFWVEPEPNSTKGLNPYRLLPVVDILETDREFALPPIFYAV